MYIAAYQNATIFKSRLNISCFLQNHLINLSMKKYILTIKYNEETDEVEYMQEEVINYIEKDILDMTPEELSEYCENNPCGKS